MQAEHRMRRQRGLITRTQAIESGLTENQVAYRLGTNMWERAHRSVYRHAAVPRTWEQEVLAATLATDGLASHNSALSLYGMTGLAIRPITVLVPHERHHRSLQAVRVRSTTQWAATQATTRRGIPCTGPERSLLDIAFDVTIDRLELLAEEMVRRRLTEFERLARFLVLHAGRGRPGSATMRAMLMRRDPTASLPLSDFSRVVYRMIEAAGLPLPILEYRVLDQQGRFVLQADLAWPDLRRIVELDGIAWHFGRSDIERDRRKRARARADGWRVMEVLWSMYEEEPRALLDLLTRFILDD